ncbi:MAG: divergent polysaccharide deacetylase family protein, partial [Alphaproteobacteria bacterium]
AETPHTAPPADDAARPHPAGLQGATDPAPPAIPSLQPQTWARNAGAAPPNPGHLPVIAIVIDDVGIVPARALAALALPAPMTLAILPYASGAGHFSKLARASGHEVLVHLPMEAENGVDPGPQALLTALTDTEFTRRLRWNLARFDGYIGLNNHMGSRLTQDSAAMGALMAEIKRRGLLFLDSRTATRTLAASTARSLGVTTLERDVFLDNVITPEAINRQLLKAEQTARQNGFAIAIGHPHAATIAALEEWAAGLEARGFKLAPLSAITRFSPAPPVKHLVSLPHPGG